jgi:hypothetical protein
MRLVRAEEQGLHSLQGQAFFFIFCTTVPVSAALPPSYTQNY